MTTKNICNICGGNYIYKDGRWRCSSCGAYKPDWISGEDGSLRSYYVYNRPGISKNSAKGRSRTGKKMNAKEVFVQLIRYFPEGQEARICNNICAFGEVCLGVGDFESAVKYADMLLSQDCSETQRISAYRTKLFAKLKCRNINEVYHCKDFKRDMPEYEELILASSSNNDKLKLFAELPKKVEETLAEAERKRRAAEEEEIARKLAEEKERERQRILAEVQRLREEQEAERRRIAAESKAEQRRIAEEQKLKLAEAKRIKKEEEERIRIENMRAYERREKMLKVVAIIGLYVLPIILLITQIALCFVISDVTARNAVVGAIGMVVLLITGFGGYNEDRRCYVIMGINILLILILYFSSC